MLIEFGMYVGSSRWFSLRLVDYKGDFVNVNTTHLILKIYRPDGSLYTTYSDGFSVDTDGTVWRLVEIASDQPTGIWRAEWVYSPPSGGRWVEEMFFVVNKVG